MSLLQVNSRNGAIEPASLQEEEWITSLPPGITEIFDSLPSAIEQESGLSPEISNGEDLLSNLPDETLLHICNFIPKYLQQSLSISSQKLQNFLTCEEQKKNLTPALNVFRKVSSDIPKENQSDCFKETLTLVHILSGGSADLRVAKEALINFIKQGNHRAIKACAFLFLAPIELSKSTKKNQKNLTRFIDSLDDKELTKLLHSFSQNNSFRKVIAQENLIVEMVKRFISEASDEELDLFINSFSPQFYHVDFTQQIHSHSLEQLIQAIQNNNLDRVLSFLNIQGVDIDSVDKEGVPLLNHLIRRSNHQIIDRLLQAPGINPNVSNKNGRTPLHFAVLRGNVEIIDRLLQAPGINPNIRDNEGETPLHLAVLRGNVEIIDRLLQAPGINPNIRDNEGGTPLHLAVLRGNVEIIDRLLQAPGINPNIRDNECDTPLHYAVTSQNDAVLNSLLEHPNIDVNAVNNLGNSPFFQSSLTHNDALAIRLLEHPNFNVNTVNNLGESLLRQVLGLNNYDLAIRLLEDPNIDVNTVDTLGSSVLHYLSSKSGSEAVDNLAFRLLEHPNIDVNSSSSYYKPLYAAIMRDNNALAIRLLEHPNIDVNASSVEGTPLEGAIRRKNLEIMDRLSQMPGLKVNNSDLFFLNFKLPEELALRLTDKILENPDFNEISLVALSKLLPSISLKNRLSLSVRLITMGLSMILDDIFRDVTKIDFGERPLY